jgi:TRAP-type C4-dicarboxylate transport system permease small subunit
MLDDLIDRCCRCLNVFIALALAVMVVMVFGNVVLRYAFNSSIAVSEEASRWLFVWMTFMGAVVALRERAHLGTDALISRLPRAGQKLCLAVSLTIMLFMCWLMFDGALQQVKINWDSTSAVMETSMGYFYASGMVFSVLAAPVLLLNLFRLATGRLSDQELVGIRESEEGNPNDYIPQGPAK